MIPLPLELLGLCGLSQAGYHLLAGLQLAIFVVVSREKVSPVFEPEIFDDEGDFLVVLSEDGEPRQRRPHAVFLTDMVASGAEGFFAAETNLAGVHQIAEEFPAGWNFEGEESLKRGD